MKDPTKRKGPRRTEGNAGKRVSVCIADDCALVNRYETSPLQRIGESLRLETGREPSETEIHEEFSKRCGGTPGDVQAALACMRIGEALTVYSGAPIACPFRSTKPHEDFLRDAEAAACVFRDCGETEEKALLNLVSCTPNGGPSADALGAIVATVFHAVGGAI
jgi:hypothetical protein